MNKVFIRTRQIDNNKQLPILLKENDDLSDFNEYSNVSKSSQIFSGMDKGEESEHHLQEVLRELQYENTVFNKAIPIPEVLEEANYEVLYKSNYKLPKHYIRLKTLDFEDELPEYDLDEEDKEWLENSRLNVTSLKFEQIIEQFEKACCQKALLLDEAKTLLRHEAFHLIISIYDYWLTKRVNTGQTLILSVKAEKAERCNNAPIDPYVAFRKRSEKMTTRKNRRVDEASYEKMYLLRKQMEKLSEIMQLVSQREAVKSHITQNERELFVKRYDGHDYDNKVQLMELENSLHHQPHQSIKLGDNFKSAQRSREENQKEIKRKRSYSKTFETNKNSIEHRQQPEDIDFTFRPMSKCKYLPSKFTTTAIDPNNNYYTTANHSIDNHQKSFSELSNSPESFKLNPSLSLCLHDHNHLLSENFLSRSDTISANQRFLKSHNNNHHFTSKWNSLSHSISKFSFPKSPERTTHSNTLTRRLLTLYYRNIHCGLLPIDYYSPYTHVDNSDNSKQFSSQTNHQDKPTNRENHRHKDHYHHEKLGVEKLPVMSFVNHNNNYGENRHHHYYNHKIDHYNQHHKNRYVASSELVKISSNCNKITDVHNTFSSSHSKSMPVPREIFSNHNGTSIILPTICTYQNGQSSYFNSNSENNDGTNVSSNNNISSTKHKSIDSVRKVVRNGYCKKKTVSMKNKDPVKEYKSNNRSVNGGNVVDSDTQLSKVVDLKYLKLLKNKTDVISHTSEMTNYYSKSNGYNEKHKNHHQNHNCLHHQNWLTQKGGSDSCLSKNNLVPLCHDKC